MSGEPPPEITWTFEGAPVENDDRMKVNNEEYKVNFCNITFLTSRTTSYTRENYMTPHEGSDSARQNKFSFKLLRTLS